MALFRFGLSRRIAPLLVLVAALISVSGLSAQFRIDEAALAVQDPGDVESPAALQGEATVYDAGVWLIVDWYGVRAGVEYRYDWYTPAGELAKSYRSRRESDSNGRSYAGISSQDLWEGGGGSWSVVFSYDGTERGRWSFTFKDPGPFRYLLHVPENADPSTGILVAVHSSSYNPVTYFHSFLPIAERHRMVLVASYFPEEVYLYNNLFTSRTRADRYLFEILDEVTAVTGADAERLFLYGQSAGGQFVHRFLLAFPEKVERIVISAPGWWTFPDPTIRYPYGIGASSSLPEEIEFDLEAVLGVPTLVLVGSLDVGRDANLRQNVEADAQGWNRVERATNWVAAMREVADRLEIATSPQLEIVPDETHSSIRSSTMERIEDFLFPPGRKE